VEASASNLVVVHPNREKSTAKATKALVALLLVASAVLIAAVTAGGWSKLQGAQGVAIAYVLVYVIMAFFVLRWNRGLLPIAAGLAILFAVMAAVAAPAWFARAKDGFENPALDPDLLGLLTLVIIGVQLLLILAAMRGFTQAWNVEVEVTPEERDRGINPDDYDSKGNPVYGRDKKPTGKPSRGAPVAAAAAGAGAAAVGSRASERSAARTSGTAVAEPPTESRSPATHREEDRVEEPSAAPSEHTEDAHDHRDKDAKANDAKADDSSSHGSLPPLLASRSMPLKFILAVLVPVIFGAITGVVLGLSEIPYVVMSLLGLLGGFFAGIEHRGARAGALRGLVGGSLFGGFILIAHEISGKEPKAHLPEPEIVLVVITTVIGALLGTLGGKFRARRENRST